MENNKLQTRKIIACPHCGAEYLPGEIFYPDNIIGQPTEIIRDALNKIIYNSYKENSEPVGEEHYYCDFCGKPFVVEFDAHYKVREENIERDFSDTTVSLW